MTTILAIDQGTTSSRAILFDRDVRPTHTAQREFEQHFPSSGHVEHEPEDLWQTVLDTAREVLEKGGVSAGDLAGIGITNQRETTLVWDRETGKPLHRALVWQDRRASKICDALREAGHEDLVKEKTGLLLDPYFSGPKLKWLLDTYEGARTKARQGKLMFGTVDTYLIWRLTGGKRHVTDATNAARTLMFNIHENRWSHEICEILGVPQEMLPEVLDSAAEFGTTDPDLLGAAVPILGVAGDQQAAAIGQACFKPGMIKSTYGTGCFALLNTGERAVTSEHRLLTTIAYRLGGQTTYALEGSIFIAGAVVQWLRDGLGVIDNAEQTQELSQKADEKAPLIMVPAFTGLGAPYWDAETRGAIFGLTRASGPAEFARAALESVGFQTRDLLDAMRADWPSDKQPVMRVDGGMANSDWTMQFLSDICGLQVDRPDAVETTALGAAWLAGMQAGVYPDQDGFAAAWSLDRSFTPDMTSRERERLYSGWQRAVKATMSA